MDDCKNNRREFLGRAAAGVVGTSLGLSYPDPTLAKTGEMTMRFLGRSKDKISLIGLGEFHLGKAVDERTAFRVVRMATLMTSPSWTTAGITRTAKRKLGWATPCATSVGKRLSS